MANYIGTRRTDIFNGSDENDTIDGGGGADTLRGGGGDDIIVYQNDANRGNLIDGGTGNDTLLVRQAAQIDLAGASQDAGTRANTVTGFENVDAREAGGTVSLAGDSGANVLRGGAHADILSGGLGADTLEGGGGADHFVYQSASDSTDAARDSILDFQSGQDKIDLRALGSGLRWSADGPLAHGVWQQRSGTSLFIHADTDGDGLANVKIELRDFAGTLARTDFLGVNEYSNAPPVVNADTNAVAEDAANPVLTGNVLQNDTDPDGLAPLAVRQPGTYMGLYGTLVIQANGDYTYTLDNAKAAVQQLRQGETRDDVFAYAATDGKAETASSLRITVSGANDAPRVSGAVQAGAVEDGAAVSLDALAAASDVDGGAQLAVVGVPAVLPEGVSFDSVTGRFTLDPAHAGFQRLAQGATMTVSVSYGVTDGMAVSPASVSWTITGANDAPRVSGAVTGNATEDGPAIVLSALANATDPDSGSTLSVVLPGSLPDGVSYDAASASFRLDPAHPVFQSMNTGQSMMVTVAYGISDGSAVTPASVSWSVAGVTDVPSNQPPVVSGPVTGQAREDDAAVVLSAPANAVDPDGGSTLSVVGLPDTLPPGVSYDAASASFRLDPSHASFQHLAEGASVTVSVAYGISDGSATTAASASWTIIGANDAPHVSGEVTAQALEDGGTFTLDAMAHALDADDGAVLQVVNLPATLPAGVSYDPGSARFTLDSSHPVFQQLAQGASMSVSVNYGVTDGKAITATSATWTITGANDAPRVSGAVTGNATEDGPTITLSALANATDPDSGQLLSVTGLPDSLPPGVSYDNASASFTLDPSNPAFQALNAGQTTVVTVSYGVSDGLTITPASVSWTVAGIAEAPVNEPPVVSGPVEAQAEEDGSSVTLYALAKVSDAPGTSFTVSLRGSLPEGVSYDAATMQFTLDPAHPVFQSLSQGQSRAVAVDYDVSDGTASTAARASWAVIGTNDAPQVSGAVTGNATEDGPAIALSALANATDPDSGSTLSVVLPDSLPDGVSYDAASASFRLDPAHAAFQALNTGQSTVVTVAYGISDGSAVTPASVSWSVAGVTDAPGNQPPVVSGPVEGQAQEDAGPVTLDALARVSDAPGTTYTVSLSGNLPAGVSYDAASMQFTLDPSHAAFQALAQGQILLVTVDYNVSDGTASTPARAAWTVTGTNDQPRVAIPVPDQMIESGGAFSFVLPAAYAFDADAAAVLSYSATLGDGSSLPSWLSFDAGTRTLSGTAPAGDGIASFALAITVRDQAGAAVQDDFVLSVVGPLRGTPGPDSNLAGTDLNDLIQGLGDNDHLYGRKGNDQLEGGTGNDYLYGEEGNDLMVGGDGDDHLQDSSGVNSFYGGEGNDTIYLGASETQLVIDGGAGNDYFYLDNRNAAQTLSTGSGSDTIELRFPSATGQAVTITDFSTGAGGDKVDIGSGSYGILQYSTGYAYGSDPFATGFLRLVQVGANAELQWDANGGAGGEAWSTVLVFSGTQAASFTIDNFKPSFNPHGTGVGKTITGDGDGNPVTGTQADDLIDGQGGNDYLNGDMGDDTLLGGAGQDNLSGGYGDDTLEGGEDNDTLNGDMGNDILRGGDGDDSLSDNSGVNSFFGGEGSDSIFINGSETQLAIDGGAGNDRFYIDSRSAAQTITSGGGSDTFEFRFPSATGQAITITDFSTGAGGDKVDIGAGSYGILQYSTGYVYGSDPFATGFLRLVQNGDNAELQWNSTGNSLVQGRSAMASTATGGNWTTLLVFAGKQVNAFTLDNFSPSFNPSGSGAGNTLTGTPDNDTMTGTQAGDVIDGLAGNDYLNGDMGNDTLYGRTGHDNLSGGYGDDTLEGGEDNDTLNGDMGNDILRGGDGDDSLSDSSGANSFFGGEGNDSIFINAGETQLVIDGGAGNDRFYIDSRSAAQTITSGGGSDTFEFRFPSATGQAITITDFSTGAGGDKIDIGAGSYGILQYSTGYAYGSDPFATGFLRLVQVGADTELQWDSNGATGGASWNTLFLFKNVQASSFTSDNFTPSFNPQGTGVGKTFTGTDDGETINGTQSGDTIDGLGGNDSLNGDMGNDTLRGGAGQDNLNGGYGDDVLEGGNDNDTLNGDMGNDILRGGDGDDHLQDSSGANSFFGGEGNDSIFINAGEAQLVIDGGAGNDRFYIDSRNVAQTVTSGSGSDTFEFRFPSSTGQAITITDFSTGAGGDKVDIGSGSYGILQYSSGYVYGSDPFATGFLRLVQAGADTELQWDSNGADGGASWSTLLVFKNVQASSFTLDNFSPSFNPQGTGIGKTIDGTADNDSISGTPANDTIHGLGGSDSLSGDFGDDTLYGGAGHDYLGGGYGDDILEGGNDNDTLNGDSGNDILRGGDGDDSLQDSSGANSLYGGNGNDTIYLQGSETQLAVDGGEGNDRFYIDYHNAAQTITTGGGSDTIEFRYPGASSQAVTVTDFTAGAGGDKIDLYGNPYWSLLANSSGYVSGTDPFATGYLRMVQNGADALLEWDSNGGAGGASWHTLMIFTGVQVADFRTSNFVPAYSPNGADPLEGIEGTEGADELYGTAADDDIRGLGGDDWIDGREGKDRIEGGSGNDTLDGGSGDDVLDGGDGDDILEGSSGNDTLIGGEGNDRLSVGASSGTDSLYGGDGMDELEIHSDLTQLVIDGGAGDDAIRFGSRDAVQTVTTGSGSDTLAFYLPSANGQPIYVTDFTGGPGGDVIDLSVQSWSLLGNSAGYIAGSNPFSTGYLRLDQFGNNTVLQWDQNGYAGGENWSWLFVLQDVPLYNLGASNFSGFMPMPPNGGTSGNDILNGTQYDDNLNGQDGHDVIYAGAGNDILQGGRGDDQLFGGEGNDLLDGGEGNDYLSDEQGNNEFYPDAGDDIILAGGDYVEIHAGDGNDIIDMNTVWYGAYVTLGSGIDTIRFASYSPGYFDVADFTAGAGGDIIETGSAFTFGMLYDAVGYVNGLDPFAAGFLRMEQGFGTASLYFDRDGVNADYSEGLVATFGRIDGTFTAENFSIGYNPQTNRGDLTSGAYDGDVLDGSGVGETIHGLDGDDTIRAGDGDDWLEGGAGADRLYGDSGNDVLYGNEGDDFLDGSWGDDVLVGGDGNDIFQDLGGYNAQYGGWGDDEFWTADDEQMLVDGGYGVDRFLIMWTGVWQTITTGGDSDLVFVTHPLQVSSSGGEVRITDFTAGPGGDRIELGDSNVGGILSTLVGWEDHTNPFSTGFLRLAWDGGSTRLQWDVDGSAGGENWSTLFVLENVYAGDLTSDNFTTGYTYFPGVAPVFDGQLTQLVGVAPPSLA